MNQKSCQTDLSTILRSVPYIQVHFTFQLAAGLVQILTVSTGVTVWMVLCVTPPRDSVQSVVMLEAPMVTCGQEPGAGLAAKWVSVSHGYMWRGAWGGPGCQVGKCQQWLHVERSLGRVWLPSG